MCHTLNESIASKKFMFPQNLISRICDYPWPHSSSDLNFIYFFLWECPVSKKLKEGIQQYLVKFIASEVKYSVRNHLKKILENFENFFAGLEECCNRQWGHHDDYVSHKTFLNSLFLISKSAFLVGTPCLYNLFVE